MSEIKTYIWNELGMVGVEDNGDYVPVKDLTALRTENERLRERIECPVANPLIVAKIERLQDENTNLRDELSVIAEEHRMVMSEKCPSDEMHCTCVPVLRREIARLREAKRELVETLEKCCESFRDNLSKYAYKNEPSMLSALNKAKAAVAKHREK